MSQTKVIALLLVGVMVAFDLFDAQMNGGTITLLAIGWGYVAWQAFLKRATATASHKLKTFKLTYEEQPINWAKVAFYIVFIGVWMYLLRTGPERLGDLIARHVISNR